MITNIEKKITSIPKMTCYMKKLELDGICPFIRMEVQLINDYIEDNKELYHSIIQFLESSNDRDDDNFSENRFEILQKIVKTQQIEEDPEELEQFLQIMVSIFNNHHRGRDFIEKFERILLFYKNKIKQTLSNEKIYEIFEDNKFILLFLMKSKIINIDEHIYNSILNKIEENGTQYCHFFYPELRKFAVQKKMITFLMLNIKKDLWNILDDFDVKRQEGENDSYICSLIRQDSIEEFITYLNRTNLPISSRITPSIFETNSFLIKNNDITLIEYSAFFGSIQIFQYLLMNKAELSPKLWLCAIHSKNAELIHLLESNGVQPPKCNDEYNDDDDYTKCFIESVKCHHNDIADYFENNLLPSTFSKQQEKIVSKCIKYHNYSYFPESIGNQEFFYLYFYNYNKLVNFLLINKSISNQKVSDINNIIAVYCMLLNQSAIEDDIFNDNTVLKKIVIPPSIKKIGSYAFLGCRSLTHVFIPSSVKSIENYSFKDCNSLKKIVIPSSVTSIGLSSFRGCSSLKKLSIPSSVTKIGGFAFHSCSSLKRISIPASIQLIDVYTFNLCTSLEQISIPSSVITIDDNAFCQCASLKQLTIPSSVKSIGKYAFAYCKSLEQVIILSSVESISEDVFYSCSSLKNVTIPSSFKNLQYIGIQHSVNISYL